jgi:endonuclease YncB( thermonuclease family)
MSYTLLTGDFVIRYPDLPRSGPEPDGDTIKFAPDTPALVDALPRVSGMRPDINGRGISVRLEAIDALETHFQPDHHQELLGADAARDQLLSALGFSNVVFIADRPNKVESADQDRVRGYVLSNGIDANGRMIGFVYPGSPDAGEADGATVNIGTARLDRSINAQLLAAGFVYPAFYDSLPSDLRVHLAGVSRAARTANSGIWARSTAMPGNAATVADLAQLETLAIWPKLFRRIVPYLLEGHSGFGGFDAFLRQDPTHRDDAIVRLDTGAAGRFHDVIATAGDTVELTLFPEDFVIMPDPAPSSQPPIPVRRDVVVIAALPNPNGADGGAETVTLLNTSAAAVDLTGWSIADDDSGHQSLSGTVAAGATVRVQLTADVQLGNGGDTIVISDGGGQEVDRVSYTSSQAREGRTIAFGR